MSNLQCLWNENDVLCEQIFQDPIDLMDHISDDHISNENTFKCIWNGCNRSGEHFLSKPKLLMHLGTHTGVGLFQCKNCDKRYVSSSSLTAHEKIIGDKTSFKFTCTDCLNLHESKMRMNQAHKSCTRTSLLPAGETFNFNTGFDFLNQDFNGEAQVSESMEVGRNRINYFIEPCRQPATDVPDFNSVPVDEPPYTNAQGSLNHTSFSAMSSSSPAELEKQFIESGVLYNDQYKFERNPLHHQSSSSSTSIDWAAPGSYPQPELYGDINEEQGSSEQSYSSIDLPTTVSPASQWQCSWVKDGVECTKVIENSAHLLSHLKNVHSLGDMLKEIPAVEGPSDNADFGLSHHSSTGASGSIENEDYEKSDRQPFQLSSSSSTASLEVPGTSEDTGSDHELGDDLLLQLSPSRTKTQEWPVSLVASSEIGPIAEFRQHSSSTTDDSVIIQKQHGCADEPRASGQPAAMIAHPLEDAPCFQNLQNQPPQTPTPLSTPSLSPTYSEPSFPIATHDVECQWKHQSDEACMKIFQGPAELRKHIFLEHRLDPKDFVCYWKDCDRVLRPFTANIYLVEHLRKHTGERPFRCKYCSRAFTTANSLKDHEKIHFHLRCPYVECSTRFRQMKALKEHLWFHKPSSDQPLIPCMWRTKGQYCTETFEEPSELTAHITGAHLPNSRGLVCRWKGCKLRGKLKRDKKELLDHIKSHYGDKEHKCGVCGNEFLRVGALKKHMKNLHPVEFAAEVALKIGDGSNVEGSESGVGGI